MLNLLNNLASGSAAPSAAPRESIPAGHELLPSFSESSTTTLPPDRRGRLKNGNRAGDFLAAPRCGARTRCGGECRQPAMKNGRCRMHGGLSTGPRTPEGLARSRRARLTHGGYAAHIRVLRAEARTRSRRVRALIALVRGRSAGHGVHRANPVLAPNPRRRPVLSGAAPLRSSGSASLRLGVSAVKPSSAGHGVHPSFRDRLRSSAALCPGVAKGAAGH